MTNKSKKILKKMSWVIISFILLEGILIIALVSINTLSHYKLEITTSLLLENIKQTFTHLVGFVKNNIAEKNPFFIIGTIFSIIYSLYTNSRNLNKKEGWETEDSNTYHGSARWSNLKEIFDTTNFIKQPKSKVQSDFKKSLEKEGK
ncbi:MAG: hypothetical protein KC455_08620 [Carnobacterium sp.]|nr:hypothetical protein [Carnobacterium sp.]